MTFHPRRAVCLYFAVNPSDGPWKAREDRQDKKAGEAADSAAIGKLSQHNAD
jgi:hypothetical protein